MPPKKNNVHPQGQGKSTNTSTSPTTNPTLPRKIASFVRAATLQRYQPIKPIKPVKTILPTPVPTIHAPTGYKSLPRLRREAASHWIQTTFASELCETLSLQPMRAPSLFVKSTGLND